MVWAINFLTTRHQHNQTLPPGTQEYAKYIHCKKLLGVYSVFFKEKAKKKRHSGAPFWLYRNIQCLVNFAVVVTPYLLQYRYKFNESLSL